MTKRKLAVALAFACSLAQALAGQCPPGHIPSVISGATGAATGNARVCANAVGVHVTIELKNLTNGHAYTVWFGYVNNPKLCISPGCGGPDYVSPNPQVAVGRLASAVAGVDGGAHVSAEINGMLVAPGSQVQLVIFDHGMASTSDLRFRARQLLTPQDPGLGAPGMGVIADGAVGQFWGIAIVNFP